jgi:hypothetical protein
LVVYSGESGGGMGEPSGVAWKAASMGAIIVPSHEVARLSVSRTGVVQREITPLLIDTGDLRGVDVGAAVTLDCGTPDRLALLGTLPKSAIIRRD